MVLMTFSYNIWALGVDFVNFFFSVIPTDPSQMRTSFSDVLVVSLSPSVKEVCLHTASSQAGSDFLCRNLLVSIQKHELASIHQADFSAASF